MNFKKLLLVLITGVSLIANGQTPPTPVPPVGPTPPTLETCAPADNACATRNQIAQQQYNNSLVNYQTLLQQYEAAQQIQLQQAQQAAAAAAAQEAALAAAKRAEKENKKGSSAYGTSQLISTAVSMALAAVCATPGGQSACAPAAMFGMFANMAGGQKASHDSSQFDACRVANQISTSPSNCGTAPAPYNPGGFPANSTTPITDAFDPGGNCIGTQEQCQAVLDNLPPGTNIRDTMAGISQFAGGKGPFSVNPDGSIKMKNGKTFGLGAFDNKKSMMDAGLSAAEADQMLAMMAKQKALGELDPKMALAKENSLDDDALADSLAAAKAAELSANGDIDGLGKNAGARSLASEGLTKDFNGELIGASGDDIFKMMNRRYRLKVTQDAFLTAAP